MARGSTDAVGTSSGERRWLGYTQFILLILIVAIALYFAKAPSRVDRDPDTAYGEIEPVVYTVEPEPTEYVQQIGLTGTITLDRKLTVVAEVVGRVIWVSPDFVNGGTIPANQVFVKIDPTEYELEVQAAEMAVASTEALVQAIKDNRDSALRESPPLAKANIRLGQAKIRLGQANAALALAKLRLSRTEISLPYTARVISSELEVGDLVGPPETVGKLLSVLGIVYRPDALQVRVPIKVVDLARFDPAIGRVARVNTLTGTYDAELSRISSVVAPETRLAKVFLKFSTKTPQESLPVPGMFAEVVIFGSRRDGVFILPEAASRAHNSIWIVADGALRAVTPVTVDHMADGWVVETFDAGDGVVVSTLAGASEGLKVTASPAPDSP